MIDGAKIVYDFLNQSDWQLKENSNNIPNIGMMNKFIDSEVCKDFWLREVYPSEIAEANVDGDIHIHDLGGLTLYCCGYSLESILLMGVKGVSNIPTSAPAKHFGSVLNQIANLTTVFQNEIMGAVAFNSFDTLLAPFIKHDGIDYKQIKQEMQNFIFSINSNSRIGAEPAFSNITFDLYPPKDLHDRQAIIGGKPVDFTYGDCQVEMDLLNRAFFEIMLNGDAAGKLFSYPIPTFNIHEKFNWDNPNNEMLWEMAGKYGIPYFANFINSDMEPDDIRSMCCRLSLDLSELRRKNGGLFGAGDSTGSIGVVTINLPRIGYEATDRDEFYDILLHRMELARDSLEIKREWLNENIIKKNFVPAFNTYVGTIDNHFSTIGVVGMNEMCENFLGEDITTEVGHEFALEVGSFIRDTLIIFQQQTGHLYNYEATPAESTCYRLARKDLNKYPDIIQQGMGTDASYYTNSCHQPVNKVTSINSNFAHQNELQQQFTGGTVIHNYLEGAITGEQAKALIKALCLNYRVPYISISPISRYCDEHGYVKEIVDNCPICGSYLTKFQRITGYLRCVDNYNEGKAQEFKDRVQLSSL